MFESAGSRASGADGANMPSGGDTPGFRSTGSTDSAGNVDERFTLKLYIAGQTPRSIAALANLRKLCEEFLPGRYDLEIVDLLLEPKRARTDQILAIPTLVRSLPTQIARIIGDLSDTEQVLLGLNIKRKATG
jgi:circadian clock protein KaiB